MLYTYIYTQCVELASPQMLSIYDLINRISFDFHSMLPVCWFVFLSHIICAPAGACAHWSFESDQCYIVSSFAKDFLHCITWFSGVKVRRRLRKGGSRFGKSPFAVWAIGETRRGSTRACCWWPRRGKESACVLGKFWCSANGILLGYKDRDFLPMKNVIVNFGGAFLRLFAFYNGFEREKMVNCKKCYFSYAAFSQNDHFCPDHIFTYDSPGLEYRYTVV